VGLLGDLFTAVVEHRIADFTYRDTARAFKAYGLVHRRGHWYLVGALLNDDIRAFRVDRISNLSLRDDAGAYARPPEFDVNRSIPDAPWEAGPEELTAEVVFDTEVAWWARRELSVNAEITEEADGGIRATLPVAHVDAFIGWMLGFVDQAEVIGPPEVRQRLLARVGTGS
ncbi:MAG: WYL domain-containing protein, partial [Acidimicrobiia bacterium]|nr:WYL domain-containing protein [Acidimicrobiia bacterium]